MRRYPFAAFVTGILLFLPHSCHAQPAAFADAKLLWTLPWDADWVTAVSFIGNDKVAAGNKLGDILVWNLPGPGAKAPPPTRRLAGHTKEITRMLQRYISREPYPPLLSPPSDPQSSTL